MNKEESKISHTIFKTMMQKYSSGSSHFKQPASVEKIRNELYIKGVKRDMVPPAPKPKKEAKKEKEKANKKTTAKNKEKGKKPKTKKRD